MKINTFEDIIAWQKSKELSILIYDRFKVIKDYSFKDQIQRASISIMNNIAEGFERGTNPELKRFLFMAKGSAGEVRSLLCVAYELKYLSQDDYTRLNSLALSISKLISSFIKSIH